MPSFHECRIECFIATAMSILYTVYTRYNIITLRYYKVCLTVFNKTILNSYSEFKKYAVLDSNIRRENPSKCVSKFTNYLHG